MAVEGFYPKNSAGYTLTSYKTFNQALPLITFVTSMITSSFGMTKFFLQGPIPILPKDSALNGLISLPFIATLFLNSMFGIRAVCIENAFFSSYRYQRYYKDEKDDVLETIDPIIEPEYRLLMYLFPSFVSFLINACRLSFTGSNIGQYIKQYPQIIIASCFTPFMFEGSKENSIRIWKLGSIFNAFFIGCLPQIVLLFMDHQRGIVNWDFIGIALKPEGIYENNDALFKSRYGNSLFAIFTGIFSLSIMTCNLCRLFPELIKTLQLTST